MSANTAGDRRGVDFFRLIAKKLRQASRELCQSCEVNPPADAVLPLPQCHRVDCCCKAVLAAAAEVERDLVEAPAPGVAVR